jgi:hypothetical protein
MGQVFISFPPGHYFYPVQSFHTVTSYFLKISFNFLSFSQFPQMIPFLRIFPPKWYIHFSSPAQAYITCLSPWFSLQNSVWWTAHIVKFLIWQIPQFFGEFLSQSFQYFPSFLGPDIFYILFTRRLQFLFFPYADTNFYIHTNKLMK